eukprot:m.15608 g.15608  ORF g.15608 m.15608 type:complete len:170 (-) comp5061_c0_seq1:56-565(-)
MVKNRTKNGVGGMDPQKPYTKGKQQSTTMADEDTQALVGVKGTASVVVEASNTASSVGSGTVDVFATPQLVLLFEQAACKALDGKLEPTKTSVGTTITVDHKAATPVGLTVTATATITEVAKGGRLISFALEASDGIDTVGAGTHQRFVVDKEKFSSRAQAKLDKQPSQ